jgi:hypothetical protein
MRGRGKRGGERGRRGKGQRREGDEDRRAILVVRVLVFGVSLIPIVVVLVPSSPSPSSSSHPHPCHLHRVPIPVVFITSSSPSWSHPCLHPGHVPGSGPGPHVPHRIPCPRRVLVLVLVLITIMSLILVVSWILVLASWSLSSRCGSTLFGGRLVVMVEKKQSRDHAMLMLPTNLGIMYLIRNKMADLGLDIWLSGFSVTFCG